jgi:hypothetical protein
MFYKSNFLFLPLQSSDFSDNTPWVVVVDFDDIQVTLSILFCPKTFELVTILWTLAE